MVITRFPNIDNADPETGLLAIGGDLEPESLYLAYSSGIFPWPCDSKYLTWFAPPIRTVLFLSELNIPRSLLKASRKSSFRFTIDTAFSEVIQACAEVINRGEQTSTWITPEIIKAYTTFHKLGFAHSIECWDETNLVGGLYGVSINGFFAGESMFYRKTNASKLAFLFLCEFLKKNGINWIDCQVTTPLFSMFGSKEISRQDFMQLLEKSLKQAPIPF